MGAVVVLSACGGGDIAQLPAEVGDETAMAAVLDDPLSRPADAAVAAPAGYLDPDAAPRSPQGRLRARYLPVWTEEFDWAFPPQACDSAWELDGVAAPTGASLIGALGDPMTAVALSVMRYEYQTSRALAEPTALAQLCVAVASVDPARAEINSRLAALLADGEQAQPADASAGFPREVVLVAVSPNGAAVALACVDPAGPGHGSAPADAAAGPRLSAYFLRLSRGLEDRVVDVSYRVSRVRSEPVADCGSLDGWEDSWRGIVGGWTDEGQIWELLPSRTTLTAEQICERPSTPEPADCPNDWPV